jgi:hypothetical protein
MRDGSGVAVPVLAYAHLDAHAVHRAIYDGSIEQAAARARQVERTAANPVEINIFANAAPQNMVFDEVVRWRDIRPDRLWDMIACGRVFENAAHMHAIYPDLFRTRRAATDARARMGDVRGRTRKLVAGDRDAWSEFAFQPAGQGQRVSRAWCRTCDVEAMRADAEAVFGALAYWRILPFTSGRGEVIRKSESASNTVLRTTSPPVMAFAPEFEHQSRFEVWRPPDG